MTLTLLIVSNLVFVALAYWVGRLHQRYLNVKRLVSLYDECSPGYARGKGKRKP